LEKIVNYIELKKKAKEFKVQLKELAKILRVSERTLQNWNKNNSVPDWVLTPIELLEQLPLEQRAGYIARKLEESEKK
jgi:DNA-binding transcriptional regulator YiaG